MDIIDTHRLVVHIRFEGSALDSEERQTVANELACLMVTFLSNRGLEDDEFCDLGLKQESNITIGGT